MAIILAAIAGVPGLSAHAEDARPQFISFESARPILQAMRAALPAELRAGLDAEQWAAWLKKADAAVRQRLEAGEEDTLTNLLRFGVTFTKEYRIDDEYFAKYGESSLVDSFAKNRAHDLVKALAGPGENQGFIEMRAMLERKGFTLKTQASRAGAEQYMLRNMARMHKEFLQARAHTKANRSQMFEDRGISLDSNLWPDYDLDLQFRLMAADGKLKPGSVRRVAIVGPGLDFVNKQEGVDSYPPQTTQPFAVMDSLVRLGLADAGAIKIDTLDISPLVNTHLAAIRKKAAAGQPYTVQLPWYSGGRWSDEFRGKFVEYWQTLGTRIGAAVAPIQIPESAAGIDTRAVRIRPAMLGRVKPMDINIVYQFLPAGPSERFDLVIGTNIFVYYGEFEQSLARANISAMLRSGGYLLSNDKLPEVVVSGLDVVTTTEIPMTDAPVMRDFVYCYRKQS